MKRAMLFIDFENLMRSLKGLPTPKRLDFDVLIRAAQEKVKTGTSNDCLVFGNCYYEYERNVKPAGMYEAYKRGLVPVYTPCFSAGADGSKSLCDSMLICDALEALYKNPAIDVFVLVTSDKDFVPLIRKIAENGKEAIVIAVENYARALRDECDRLGFAFFDYLQLEVSLKPDSI